MTQVHLSNLESISDLLSEFGSHHQILCSVIPDAIFLFLAHGKSFSKMFLGPSDIRLALPHVAIVMIKTCLEIHAVILDEIKVFY